MTNLTNSVKVGTVYFVGAGPGAPDLITVRGQRVIAEADLILYADSLVEESVAGLARRPQARIERSSGLHLEQILSLLVETAQAGGVVARIHSGDPALYGAVHEQMAYLEDYDVPYEIVPGVTAAFAAAAQLKTELTVPDVVQTIILTRTAGRTTMPEGEDLRTLAAPGASLAIYLSVGRIRQVVDDLLSSGGYGPDTPVAVHHKVTWPDESCVTGSLADIVDQVKDAGYTKHALILVSPALDPRLKGAQRRTSSHLYDKSYTHRFRRAEDFKRGKERREATAPVDGVVVGDKHLAGPPRRSGCVVIAITKQGSRLAASIAAVLDAGAVIPRKFASDLPQADSNIAYYGDSALAEVRRRWPKQQQLVLVMPAGVAVRAVAPLLGHKSSDPAVICLDEAGRSVIPLIGGHQAGANALARRIATFTQGRAAITTASDVQGKPALDQLGRAEGWRIEPAGSMTFVSACLVNGDPIGLYIDPALNEMGQQTLGSLENIDILSRVDSPDELDLDAYAAGIIISHRLLSDHHRHLLRKSIQYYPPVLVAGIGCKRGVPAESLRRALETTLSEAGLAPGSITALATVDLKADEEGLQTLAADFGIPLKIIAGSTLARLNPDDYSPSAAREKLGLPGVAEPCAMIAAGPESKLLVHKRSFESCTVAVALRQSEKAA